MTANLERLHPGPGHHDPWRSAGPGGWRQNGAQAANEVESQAVIRFSKMADYGVLLLGHFAQHADDLTSAASLSEAYHMPRTVVANLLKGFREAGLLSSERGLHGGYRLARAPEDITLLDVLRVIEGPVHIIECAAVEALTSCDYEDVCPSRSPMQAVNQKIVALLDGISLAELMHETRSIPTNG